MPSTWTVQLRRFVVSILLQTSSNICRIEKCSKDVQIAISCTDIQIYCNAGLNGSYSDCSMNHLVKLLSREKLPQQHSRNFRENKSYHLHKITNFCITMHLCKPQKLFFCAEPQSHFMTASKQYIAQNAIRWPADCSFAEMSVRYVFHDTNQKIPSKFVLLFLLMQVQLEADLHNLHLVPPQPPFSTSTTSIQYLHDLHLVPPQTSSSTSTTSIYYLHNLHLLPPQPPSSTSTTSIQYLHNLLLVPPQPPSSTFTTSIQYLHNLHLVPPQPPFSTEICIVTDPSFPWPLCFHSFYFIYFLENGGSFNGSKEAGA